MPVPGGEQGSVDRNRQEECSAGDEFLAVDVPSPDAGRRRWMPARLGRRHPEHTEERPQDDLAAVLIVSQSAIGIERPLEPSPLAPGEAEPRVQRCLETSTETDPERSCPDR